MTHYRRAGSVDHKLLETLRALSPDEIEAATGKSHDHLYNVSNPTTQHGLHFVDAARLDAALMAKGLSRTFAPLLDDLTRQALAADAPADPASSIDSLLIRSTAELGQVHAVAMQFMQDGRLEPQERARIAQEAQDVIDVMQALRDQCEPPCGPRFKEVGA